MMKCFLTKYLIMFCISLAVFVGNVVAGSNHATMHSMSTAAMQNKIDQNSATTRGSPINNDDVADTATFNRIDLEASTDVSPENSVFNQLASVGKMSVAKRTFGLDNAVTYPTYITLQRETIELQSDIAALPSLFGRDMPGPTFKKGGVEPKSSPT